MDNGEDTTRMLQANAYGVSAGPVNTVVAIASSRSVVI